MAAVVEPLKSGWLVQGPYVSEFETKFARYTGAEHAIATTSCTTAMHIALAAAGIGPGDEVIVPAFTWIATANVVEYLGATPVFCDIELDTFNIDVNRAKELITPRTRALMPVHLFGLPANMDAIGKLAAEHGLTVVEDAACGFGAWYKGRHVGNFGHYGCFSFHPRKAITTGEGGMILAGDTKAAELCRTLRDHGASKTDLARHQSSSAFLLPSFDHLGYNYRMTDLQGAVGSMQMDKASYIQEQRTARARRYDQMLNGLTWLRTPMTPKGSVHGFQSYVCLFRPEAPTLGNLESLHSRRNDLMAKMEAAGVSTRQGTHAVTSQGYYANKYGVRKEDFPNATIAEGLSLTLPVYPQMTDDEQDYVVEQLFGAYQTLACAA
jgi:dTDP-4-amino-4,6-dideoxygalactose transaminase